MLENLPKVTEFMGGPEQEPEPGQVEGSPDTDTKDGRRNPNPWPGALPSSWNLEPSL